MVNHQTNYSFDNPFIGGKSLLIPISLKLLARFVLKRFKQKHNDENIDFLKAESLLESLLRRETRNDDTGQRPTHALCRQLTAKPFWEAQDHPLLNAFKQNLVQHTDDIAQEYLNAVGKENLPQQINTGKGFLPDNSWLNIRLGSLGNYSARARNLFPKTIALLEPYGQRIFSAEFIIMEPGTTLPPHTDATNAYLVGHLGLVVPEGCGYQVKDCIKNFSEGDLVFFDQSFVHSAWNKGESRRVNLLVTLFHPEISEQETQLILSFIKTLQKYALIFSPIILVDYFFMKLYQRISPKKPL